MSIVNVASALEATEIRVESTLPLIVGAVLLLAGVVISRVLRNRGTGIKD